MKRVMVIGPCGAGKSTVSHRLGMLLSLPVHHLDKLHWRAGWTEGSQEELRADLAPIYASERWLIDGNYSGTIGERLERADTVVYLDYPIPLCFWRALKRVWKYHGRNRPDMAEGCPERFNLEFFAYILMWNSGPRVRTERILKGSEHKVHRFKNPAALARWLDELETTI